MRWRCWEIRSSSGELFDELESEMERVEFGEAGKNEERIWYLRKRKKQVFRPQSLLG